MVDPLSVAVHSQSWILETVKRVSNRAHKVSDEQGRFPRLNRSSRP